MIADYFSLLGCYPQGLFHAGSRNVPIYFKCLLWRGVAGSGHRSLTKLTTIPGIRQIAKMPFIYFYQPVPNRLNTPYPGLVAQRIIYRLLCVYCCGIVKFNAGVGLIDQHTDFCAAEDYTLDFLLLQSFDNLQVSLF